MTTREDLIRSLCTEAGAWGDGRPATYEAIEDAAQDPMAYDIDPGDLDAACEGDVAALLRLRAAWRLPALR